MNCGPIEIIEYLRFLFGSMRATTQYRVTAVGNLLRIALQDRLPGFVWYGWRFLVW